MTNATQYAGDNQGFAKFMRRVDIVIGRVSGMSFMDFADVMWHDLYDDMGEEASDEDICELLADGDMIFAEMYAIHMGED